MKRDFSSAVWIRRADAALYAAGLVCFLALFLGSLTLILQNKVNLPYADEWGTLNPFRGLDRDLSARWLLSTANSHPIVLVRLLEWWSLISTGFDFRIQAVLHTALVAATGVALLPVLRGVGPVAPWLMAGMFTAQQSLTLFWPHQTFFIFAYLFMLTGAWLVSRDDKRSSIIGYALIAFGTLQSGGGPPTSLAAAFVAISFVPFATEGRKFLHIGGAVTLVATVVLWLFLGERDNPFEVLALPWTWDFWRTVSELAANGIGSTNSGIGAIVTLVLVAGAGALFVMTVRRESGSFERFALMFAAMTLAVAGAIALSRTTVVGSGSTLRYHPVGFQMLAATLFVINALLRAAPWHRQALLAWTALFAISVLYRTDLPPAYRSLADEQAQQVSCAREFFSGRGSACRELGGPYSDEVQIRVTQRSRELSASWCFTIIDMSPVNPVGQCYQRLFLSWPREG